MLSITVVNDEKVFSDRLCRFIEQYGKEKREETTVACFQDGIEITEDFKSRWDIIFLDIQMKHMDGLETARSIRACDSDVIIIFVTTMAQYAINGYEADTFDYVLKLLEYQQFLLRMNKAVRELEKRRASRAVYLKKYSDRDHLHRQLHQLHLGGGDRQVCARLGVQHWHHRIERRRLHGDLLLCEQDHFPGSKEMIL